MRAPETDLQVCERILPSVSRTFALTIRVLPGPLRRPVTVAYLLCRLADILEDASADDPRKRVSGLDTLGLALSDPGAGTEELSRGLDAAGGFALDAASALLLRARLAVFRAFAGLPAAQREVIAHWVRAMCNGMSAHVAREIRQPARVAVATAEVGAKGEMFATAWSQLPRVSASGGESVFRAEAAPSPTIELGRVPFVLETMEELRTYAWYVAGTVGHLLTELFVLHFGLKAVPGQRMRSLAGQFGSGLQFTNILQDLAEDRVRGWSYVPEELARRRGTSARYLDDPSKRPQGLRVVGDLVRETAGCLDQALEYTLQLPRRAPRVRLFCLWPTFFAMRTLVRIYGEESVLTGGAKIRITRGQSPLSSRESARSASNLPPVWQRAQ